MPERRKLKVANTRSKTMAPAAQPARSGPRRPAGRRPAVSTMPEQRRRQIGERHRQGDGEDQPVGDLEEGWTLPSAAVRLFIWRDPGAWRRVFHRGQRQPALSNAPATTDELTERGPLPFDRLNRISVAMHLPIVHHPDYDARFRATIDFRWANMAG